MLGDGPLGGLTVDASSSGRVRAYLRNPTARLPPLRAVTTIAPERLSLAPAVGQSGIVHVVRDLGLRETFSGETQIATGEIDDDVEHYLIASEQIDSALACDGLLMDPPGNGGGDGAIAISGGVLIQALPGSEGAEIVAGARERLRAGALTRALATRPVSVEELAPCGVRRRAAEVTDPGSAGGQLLLPVFARARGGVAAAAGRGRVALDDPRGGKGGGHL